MKKKLPITDRGADDIVISTATSLGVTYTQDKYECGLEIPKGFGKGFLKAYCFEDGFDVLDNQYTLTKDFYYELKKGQVHPLKIAFNTGDTFYHRLEKETTSTAIEFSNTIIVASTPENNHRFMIPAHTNSSILSLEIDRKDFEKRIIEYIDDLDPEIKTLFRDLNGVIAFSDYTSFSYDIGIMIEEFRNCKLQGMRKNLYLESKAREIFSCFLEQYVDDHRKPEKQVIFRQNQITFIKKAGDYIKLNISEVPIVSKLANKFGLNQNTLQNGFKVIYGMSVNEFIQNERLVKCKMLLIESEYSISEIADIIGINSKSYLSKIFLNKYECSPSEYRSRHLNSKNKSS